MYIYIYINKGSCSSKRNSSTERDFADSCSVFESQARLTLYSNPHKRPVPNPAIVVANLEHRTVMSDADKLPQTQAQTFRHAGDLQVFLLNHGKLSRKATNKISYQMCDMPGAFDALSPARVPSPSWHMNVQTHEAAPYVPSFVK